MRSLTVAAMLGVAADARVLTAATGPQEPPQVVGAPADAPATNGPKRVRHPLPPARVPVPGPPVAIDVADAALVKKWGIRFQSMRLSAAGYMLDFRYSVVDARKAKPLFERKTKPVLRDEASGVQMAVPVPPKTGALRNSNDPKAGKTYFMFFANPGRFIARGNLVTVTIGDFRVSGIRVDGEPLTDTARR